MIILVPGLTFKAYLENPSVILLENGLCPRCAIRPLTKHDAYLRWVYTFEARVQIQLFRRRCRPCRLTVTLLPDFLIPYFRYLGEIVASAVESYLSTALSYRRVAVSMSSVVLPLGMSVTDALLSIPTQPSYQRVFAWVERLCCLGQSYASSVLAWILRLSPDPPVRHALADQNDQTLTKAIREPKQKGLRCAAILRRIASLISTIEPSQDAWLPLLNRFVSRILGQIPWRAPPLPHRS